MDFADDWKALEVPTPTPRRLDQRVSNEALMLVGRSLVVPSPESMVEGWEALGWERVTCRGCGVEAEGPVARYWWCSECLSKEFRALFEKGIDSVSMSSTVTTLQPSGGSWLQRWGGGAYHRGPFYEAFQASSPTGRTQTQWTTWNWGTGA